MEDGEEPSELLPLLPSHFNCRSKGREIFRERNTDSSQSSIMVFSSFEGGIKDNLLSWDFMHLWRMSLFTNNDLIEGFQQPDPSSRGPVDPIIEY